MCVRHTAARAASGSRVDRPEGKTVVVEASDTHRLAAGRPVGLKIIAGYVFKD